MKLTSLFMVLVFSALSAQATPGGRWGDFADQDIQTLQAQLSQLQNQQYAVQNDVDRLQRDVDYARGQAANDQRVLQQAGRELDQLQRDISNLQNRIPQMENQLRADKAKKDQDIRTYTAQVNQLNADIPNLQNQARQVSAEALALSKQRNPAKITANQAAIRQKQTDINTKNTRLVEVNKLIEKYKACHVNECLPYVSMYEREKAKLTGEIAQLNKDISALNAEIAQLNNVERSYQAKVQQQQALQTQIDQKQRALVVAQNNLREAQGRVIRGEAELNQAKAQLAESQRRLPMAQGNYNRAQAQASISQRNLDQADGNLRYRLQDLQAIQRQVSDVQRKISDLQSRPVMQHLVLVGNGLSSTMANELSLSRVGVVNVDVPGIDLSRVQNTQVALYIMADSLTVGLSAELALAVQNLISSGGLVVVVGNPNQVTKTAGAEHLKKLIGVRAASSGMSQSVSGRGVLLNFQLSTPYKTYALNTLAGDIFVEQSLVDYSGQTVGASTTVQLNDGYVGRVITIGVDLTASSLQVLAGVEQAYCNNISQTEMQSRPICQ